MKQNWQCQTYGQQLAQRLASLCQGYDKRRVRAEALAVVCWALGALDWRIVDGVIGSVQGDEVRPVLPRAFAYRFHIAAANAGIRLDPFDPDRRPGAQATRAAVPLHSHSCVCQGTGWLETQDDPLVVRRCPGMVLVTPSTQNGSR